MTINLQTRYIKNNHLRRIIFVTGTPILLISNLAVHFFHSLLVLFWFALIIPAEYAKQQGKFVFGPIIKFWNNPDVKTEGEDDD